MASQLIQRVQQQVAGIFAQNDVEWEYTDSDGSGYVLRVGSTAVSVEFEDWHDDVVITLWSVLLTDPQQHGDARTRMLERINELNQSIPLGRVYAQEADPETETPPMIMLEYHLLGKNLDLSEFMPALDHLAYLADDLDENLKNELGGRVLFEDEDDDAVDT